jgi:hypothetical protein
LLLNDKVLNFITNEEEYKGAKGKNARKKQYELPFQENLQISFIGVMYEIILGCLCTKLAIPARPA